MEKYNVPNHLFYDGYDLNKQQLSNYQFIYNVLALINKYVFNNKGKITMIPYFNGKIKSDGGISGIILGDGFHFTCHTFCYKNTVFIDFYGDDSKKETVSEIIFDSFKTDNFDMGSKDKKGNFGKHIIISTKAISYADALKKVNQILKEIDMTPITNVIVNKNNEDKYDILQPIAESHISFHRNSDTTTVDAFSCKYFDVNKFLSLMGVNDRYIEVNRGLKYQK